MVTTAQVLTDWTFWSFVVAALALAVSLAGPIRRALKTMRLLMDVHPSIALDGTFGSPQANMYIDLRNDGGRSVRVKAMTMSVARDGSDQRVIPGQVYFETTVSQQPLLLVPFDIKPAESWGHSVKFFAVPNRQLDHEIRENISRLKENIRIKREALEPSQRTTVVNADDEFVTPFIGLFERQFYWKPGEYIADVKIMADPKKASVSRSFRFVIYETEAAELKTEIKSYKVGERIYFNSHIPVAIHPAISPI